MLKRIKKRCSPQHKKNKTETSIDDNHNINANHIKHFDNNYNIVDNNIDEKCDNDITGSSENENNINIHTTPQITSTIMSLSRSTETATSTIVETATSTSNQNLDNSIQPPKKNKKITFLGSRLFKKHKDSIKNNHSHIKLRKASAPTIERTKAFSKSIGNLFDRRHSTPGWIQGSANKGLKDGSETSSRSSRSSVASLETLRENRRSVITKLDEYIKHVKKSIDEENIANAPKRLCCAELLRTVYLRRERQCHYESLHHNINNNRKHHSTRRSSDNSDPYLQTRSTVSHTNSRSLQDFNNTSFDSETSNTKVTWNQNTSPESEISSVCNNGYNTDDKDCDGFSTARKVGNRAGNCDSGCSSDDDKELINNNTIWDADEPKLSFDDYDDKLFTDNGSIQSNLNFREMMGSKYRRKSMPLFPQALDIDIY